MPLPATAVVGPLEHTTVTAAALFKLVAIVSDIKAARRQIDLFTESSLEFTGVLRAPAMIGIVACPREEVNGNRRQEVSPLHYGLGLTVIVAAVGPDDGDEMLPDVAVIIVVCGEVNVVTAVNKPLLLIVPALVLEEAHVALFVMSSVVPFEVVATALSCAVPPTFILVVCGITAIDVMFPS